MTRSEAVNVLKTLINRWQEDENMYEPTMEIIIDDKFMDAIYLVYDLLKE